MYAGPVYQKKGGARCAPGAVRSDERRGASIHLAALRYLGATAPSPPPGAGKSTCFFIQFAKADPTGAFKRVLRGFWGAGGCGPQVAKRNGLKNACRPLDVTAHCPWLPADRPLLLENMSPLPHSPGGARLRPACRSAWGFVFAPLWGAGVVPSHMRGHMRARPREASFYIVFSCFFARAREGWPQSPYPCGLRRFWAVLESCLFPGYP